MFILRCTLPAGVRKCEMRPCLMMTALILFSKSQGTMVNRKRSVSSYVPIFIGVWWLAKSANIRPFAWHCTWAPQRCRARWHREIRIGKGFFNDTDGFSIVAAWAAPSGTVEATSNQVHMLRQHHTADCKGELLRDAALFGKLIVDV